MRPRLIYRTHFQVAEPAYLEILVKTCTSPVQGTYVERIAEKLSRRITTLGRTQDNPRFGLNVPAAAFAVDLARGLSIITSTNTWTDKGHLVALVATVGHQTLEEELCLDPSERLLHFRLFLDGDGAALMYIARQAVTGGAVKGQESDWNKFARAMFLSVYQEYLSQTSDTADRLSLRKELDRLRSKPFSGKTGCHKSFIHLQTLYRLGLLDRTDSGGQREYTPSELGRTGLPALLKEVPSYQALEHVAETSNWARIAAAVLHPGHSKARIPSGEILSLVVSFYRRICSTGVPLCSLTTVVDAVQIHLLAARGQLIERKTVLDALTDEQKKRPRDVRFHVDRKGRPAFLKLSEAVTDCYAER